MAGTGGNLPIRGAGGGSGSGGRGGGRGVTGGRDKDSWTGKIEEKIQRSKIN